MFGLDGLLNKDLAPSSDRFKNHHHCLDWLFCSFMVVRVEIWTNVVSEVDPNQVLEYYRSLSRCIFFSYENIIKDHCNT